MNEELKRIKSKDFSKIDEQLYDDLSRADNLTTTFGQLSDFQRFLMEQISSLNQGQPNSNSNIIAKSIAKNFDNLKESLVKCSRIQERCEKTKVIMLKNQLKSVKEELKEAKRTINQQIKDAGMKNDEQIRACFQQILVNFDKERAKNDQLSKKYQQIQNQNDKLKLQNQKLKKMINFQKQQEKIHNEKIEICPIKIHTEANYRTPLKQSNYLEQANSNFVTKDESWKVTRNQITEGLHADPIEKRNNSLKRQTSNHELPRKSHINCLKDKENESLVLKSKGVTMEELKRGKSKQKIKLFSMI